MFQTCSLAADIRRYGNVTSKLHLHTQVCYILVRDSNIYVTIQHYILTMSSAYELVADISHCVEGTLKLHGTCMRYVVFFFVFIALNLK